MMRRQVREFVKNRYGEILLVTFIVLMLDTGLRGENSVVGYAFHYILLPLAFGLTCGFFDSCSIFG